MQKIIVYLIFVALLFCTNSTTMAKSTNKKKKNRSTQVRIAKAMKKANQQRDRNTKYRERKKECELQEK